MDGIHPPTKVGGLLPVFFVKLIVLKGEFISPLIVDPEDKKMVVTCACSFCDNLPPCQAGDGQIRAHTCE